jgi:hypothetical protein
MASRRDSGDDMMSCARAANSGSCEVRLSQLIANKDGPVDDADKRHLLWLRKAIAACDGKVSFEARQRRRHDELREGGEFGLVRREHDVREEFFAHRQQGWTGRRRRQAPPLVAAQSDRGL